MKMRSRDRWMTACAVVALLCGPAAHAQVSSLWESDEPDATVSVRLNARGGCQVWILDKASGKDYYSHCRWWVHGSRVRFRAWDSRDGEGLGALDLEHDRAADTLILHGERDRVLRRVRDGQAGMPLEMRPDR